MITMDVPTLPADEEANESVRAERRQSALRLRLDHMDLRRSRSALNQIEKVYDKLIKLRFQESDDEAAQMCLEAAQSAISALVVMRQNIDLLRISMGR